MTEFTIQGKKIGPDHPVYFIADIASNHGGELSLAKELIHACAESGVDAVKMQNFTAESLVSDYGFRNLNVETHQSSWKQSVFDSYDAASIPLSWTEELKQLCDSLSLAYFTSPYSVELVDAVAPHVSAFKIGSGDITWFEVMKGMLKYDLPILLATGASEMSEVEAAMEVLSRASSHIMLMQCNTEYTANLNESEESRNHRFGHINLKVLQTYANKWPGIPLGLSDHTHGPMTVLGAVGLYGCCAVEKHFSLDNTQKGQDHSFSMTPESWAAMASLTSQLKADLDRQKPQSLDERFDIVKQYIDDPEGLDLAIGDGIKKVEANEKQTRIVQRRAIRATRPIAKGETLTRADLVSLRPCPPNGISPSEIDCLSGRTLTKSVKAGEHLTDDSFR